MSNLIVKTNSGEKVINKNDWFLIVCILATVLYSRFLTYFGVPSVFNFFHYAFIMIGTFFVLLKPIKISAAKIFKWNGILLFAILLSGVANGTGLLNVFLEFLLLSEPFLFLAIANNKKWDEKYLNKIRKFVFSFFVLNVVFSLFQAIVLGQKTDFVRGLFLGLGAGSHVTGAITIAACVYFLRKEMISSRLTRAVLLISSVFVLVYSDNKQSLAVSLISLGILVFMNAKKLRTMFKYVVGTIVASFGVYLSAITVFPAILGWAHFDYIETGLTQKFKVFELFGDLGDSFYNVLFGLGPGYTVGRLGQILPDYYSLLSQLGATTSPITDYIFSVQEANWVSNSITGSSMWSLLFSLAGVYGDLGLIGISIYLMLFYLVFKFYCKDNISKYLLVSAFVHGCVFQWWEEPAYMLFVFTLILIRYQEKEYIIDKTNILKLKRIVFKKKHVKAGRSG